MSISVAVIPLSSPVGEVEHDLGTELLASHGVELHWHPKWKRTHRFYAGTAEERAESFFEWARDDRHSVIWNARGGYGAIQLLPHLKRLTLEHGKPPKKLLVGSSDTTALFDFALSEWGWRVLHANMPGNTAIHEMNTAEWAALKSALEEGELETIEKGWGGASLKRYTSGSGVHTGRLIGGNFAILTALLGTPFEWKGREGDILFVEDVTESYSRLDRMWDSLRLSGLLDRVQGVILGNFLECRDVSPQVLAEAPQSQDPTAWGALSRKPLRSTVDEHALFQEWAHVLEGKGKFLFSGLPAGHGPRYAPIPIGAQVEVGGAEGMKLTSWGLDTSD